MKVRHVAILVFIGAITLTLAMQKPPPDRERLAHSSHAGKTEQEMSSKTVTGPTPIQTERATTLSTANIDGEDTSATTHEGKPRIVLDHASDFSALGESPIIEIGQPLDAENNDTRLRKFSDPPISTGSTSNADSLLEDRQFRPISGVPESEELDVNSDQARWGYGDELNLRKNDVDRVYSEPIAVGDPRDVERN